MTDATMGELGAVSVAIKADISSFLRDTKAAKGELQNLETASKPTGAAFSQMFSKGKEAASGMRESFIGAKEAVEAFIAALAVEKLYELVKGSLEWAQSLKDLSEQTGLTTTKIQELQFRALQFGITTEQLTTGLDFFTKSFGSFIRDQSGPGAKAFTDIGMKAAITSGQVQTTGEALDFAFDKLSKMKQLSTAGADASELFGRMLGVKLGPMLRQAADEVARLNTEAAKLGFIVKPESVDEMAQANIKMETLWNLTKRDFATEIGKIAPEIKDLTGQLIAGLPAVTNWIDHWLTFFGIIDKHSMASLDGEIARTQQDIWDLTAQMEGAKKSWTAPFNALGSIVGLGTSQEDFQVEIDAAKKKLAELQAEREKLGKQPKAVTAPLNPTQQMQAYDDAISAENDKIGILIDQRAALSKMPAGAARDSAFAAETKAIVAEQAQLAKLEQQKRAYLNLHPELKIHVGAKPADLDEAHKLADERAALAEKITAYDAAMATADDKASKDMIAAQDAAAIKSAENSNNKIAQFDAETKSAKDLLAAEIAVINAEKQQQLSALDKLNAENRKLTAQEYALKHGIDQNKVTPDFIQAHGYDMDDIAEQREKIEKETQDRITAVQVKAQSDEDSRLHDRIEYESQAAYQIRDVWISSINDSFTAFENFVENGGSAMQALTSLAKQVANDIFNTFLRLSIENPLLNTLYGGQPGYTLLPTMGVGGNGYGSGGMLGGLANWLGLGSNAAAASSTNAGSIMDDGTVLGALDGGNRPTGNAGDPVYTAMDPLSGGLFGGGSGGGGGISGWLGSLFGGGGGGTLTGQAAQDLESGNITGSLISDALGGGSGSGGGSDVGTSFDIGQLIGEGLSWIGLATGGPVSAGDAYMVGEQGPEMFVSDRAGTIVPHDQLGAVGSGSGHTFNFNFNGPTDGPSVLRAQSQIESMLTRAVSRGQRGL